ncbi:glutamate ligase domain-containing protein [Propioniciclava coleopterorum]|uniref:glutamate ligase domain-containing protein n=1 Tax=Propioniciclava coleopterorum TaxID=2714937 RepID=UPI001FEC1583|nr:cyanophycin synthetase [Propioniciclava coleopterorum]
MELVERADGLAILNDAYNANPDSMHAALDTLAGLRREGGRLLAGLGDMLELGEGAEEQHRLVGEHAARLGIEVVAVGEFGPAMAAAATAAGAGASMLLTWLISPNASGGGRAPGHGAGQGVPRAGAGTGRRGARRHD